MKSKMTFKSSSLNLDGLTNWVSAGYDDCRCGGSIEFLQANSENLVDSFPLPITHFPAFKSAKYLLLKSSSSSSISKFGTLFKEVLREIVIVS